MAEVMAYGAIKVIAQPHDESGFARELQSLARAVETKRQLKKPDVTISRGLSWNESFSLSFEGPNLSVEDRRRVVNRESTLAFVYFVECSSRFGGKSARFFSGEANGELSSIEHHNLASTNWEQLVSSPETTPAQIFEQLQRMNSKVPKYRMILPRRQQGEL